MQTARSKKSFKLLKKNTENKEIKHIGSGQYGDVFSVIDKDKTPKAIKVIEVPRTQIGSILRELSVHNDVASTSPYLMNSLGYFYDSQTNKLILEMPKAKSSLQEEMKLIARDLLPSQLFVFIYRLFCGLHVLHSAGIVHFDLKPGNILIFQKGDELIPKIADFGLATFLQTATDFLPDYKITAMYRPPEMLQGNPGDEKADIWSMGIVLLEILYTYLTRKIFPVVALYHSVPTMQALMAEQYENLGPLQLLNLPFRYDLPTDFAKRVIATDFEDMVKIDPFPYVTFLADLLPLLLKKDPKERPSTATILRQLEEEARKAKLPLPPCTVSLVPQDSFDFNTEGKCSLASLDFDEKQNLSSKEQAIAIIEQSLCDRMGEKYDTKDTEMKRVFREMAKTIYSQHFFNQIDLKDDEFTDRLDSVIDRVLKSPSSPVLPLYRRLSV